MATIIANPSNSISLIGRLASDPKVFENRDGSKKVLGTIMVNGSKAGTVDAIPFQAFVPARVAKAGKLNGWGSVHKGDLVHMSGSLRSGAYTGADGNTVYTLAVTVQGFTFLESRSAKAARGAAPAVTEAPAEELPFA